MMSIKWETTFIEENGQLDCIVVRATYIGDDGMIRNSSKVIKSVVIETSNVGINWLICETKARIWEEFREEGLV